MKITIALFSCILPFFFSSLAGTSTREFSQLVIEGDIHFQEQNFAEAILKYEKASKINSGHTELLRNLTAAYENTANSASTLFISDIHSISNQIFNPKLKDAYACISYILLIVSMTILYRATFNTKHRKAHLIAYSFTLLSLILAISTVSDSLTEAIVTEPETKVYESTSETAPLVTSVNPGYKVKVLKSFEEWSSVVLPTQQTGWIKNKTITKI